MDKISAPTMPNTSQHDASFLHFTIKRFRQQLCVNQQIQYPLTFDLSLGWSLFQWNLYIIDLTADTDLLIWVKL